MKLDTTKQAETADVQVADDSVLDHVHGGYPGMAAAAGGCTRAAAM